MHPTSPATYARAAGIWTKHGAPLLKKKRLAQLDADAVAVFYGALVARKVGPATIAKLRLVLHRAINAARTRRAFVGDNPFSPKLVTPPRYVEQEQRWLSQDGARRLIAACEASSDPLEGIVVLALATGMRFGEIAGLKWNDIDTKRKSLAIRRSLCEISGAFSFSGGKTSSARRKVSLDVTAVDWLHFWLHARP